jgi:hypothetical protein
MDKKKKKTCGEYQRPSDKSTASSMFAILSLLYAAAGILWWLVAGVFLQQLAVLKLNEI